MEEMRNAAAAVKLQPWNSLCGGGDLAGTVSCVIPCIVLETSVHLQNNFVLREKH